MPQGRGWQERPGNIFSFSYKRRSGGKIFANIARSKVQGTRRRAQAKAQGSKHKHKAQGTRVQETGFTAIRIHSKTFAIIRVRVNSRYENRTGATELSYWQF